MLPLRILWYNHVKRHWQNWRIRRWWRNDPNRPKLCPQAGAITQDTLDWAEKVFKEIDHSEKGKPFSELRAEVMARRQSE